jgi:hypothetical protein
MQKIQSISASQWAAIHEMRQSIYDLCATPADHRLAEQAVEALYTNASKQPPKVLFCKSPLEGVLLFAILKQANLGANLRDTLWANLRDTLRANLGDNLGANLGANLRDTLWANLGDNLGANLGANLWANLRDNLGANLGDTLWANLGDNLGDNLRANLWDTLRDNLGANLRDNLGDNLRANLRDTLRDTLRDNLWAFYYEKARLGFYLGGEIAGVKYDLEKRSRYKLIAQNLDFILPFENICIVCDRPIKIGWHDAGGIHCEDGPAVEYADGYKLWALEGYLVPEQVVMAPETQTLEDIHQEENEEIRRIRINRFGWSRYISKSHGEVLDIAMPRYGGMESLIKTSMGNVLCTYDPSTGRPYSLEVPASLKICEQAQRYLLAPEVAFGRHGVDVEEIQTYPLIRA